MTWNLITLPIPNRLRNENITNYKVRCGQSKCDFISQLLFTTKRKHIISFHLQSLSTNFALIALWYWNDECSFVFVYRQRVLFVCRAIAPTMLRTKTFNTHPIRKGLQIYLQVDYLLNFSLDFVLSSIRFDQSYRDEINSFIRCFTFATKIVFFGKFS